MSNIPIHSKIIKKDGMITVKNLMKSPALKKIDLTKHEELKNDLKYLYTAITRTRQRLIIYDENINKRKAFEKMVAPFNILQNIDEKNFEELVYFSVFSVKNLFLSVPKKTICFFSKRITYQ